MDRKSEFGSVVLTAIFGPFGLLYSNVIVALSMIMAWIVLLATYLDNFSRADSFRELCGIIYFGGGSIKNSEGYFFVGCFLYIVTIVLGMIMVIKYNNEMKKFIDAKIDKKIAKKDPVWTILDIDSAKAEKLGVAGLTRNADSYVFVGAQRKAWDLLKYEVKAELENQGFNSDYDIATSMRMRRENQAIQMEFSLKEKTIKINLENIALPIAIEKLFKHEESEAVDVSDDANAEKVFCTKCGKENNSDAKFCTSCGAGIATSA
jgi:hypothetical protein